MILFLIVSLVVFSSFFDNMAASASIQLEIIALFSFVVITKNIQAVAK